LCAVASTVPSNNATMAAAMSTSTSYPLDLVSADALREAAHEDAAAHRHP